ncbi:uncharacterized protein [Apostichopus japonicus]|uniref:uncharacterized protein isoform X2 n=1 Tax=Stichopus japonicus TaxID=307972 RepID=UPI003AB4BD81
MGKKHGILGSVACVLLVQFALKTQAIDDDQLVVSLAGSDVTLPCQTQNGNCSWERKVSNVNVVIIHNSEKVSNHSTDNNVNLRLEDTGCPLTITGVTSQNEGLYVCTTNGTTTSIQLKVDEPLPLYVYVNDDLVTSWHYYVTLGDTINVTCRSDVVNENSITCMDFPLSHSHHEDHLQCEGDVGKNAVNNMYHVTHKDGAIVCTAWEDDMMLNVHKVALHVRYTPQCYLQITKGGVNCACDANPPLLYYVININGIAVANDTATTLEPSFHGNLSCTGVNEDGEYTSTEVLYQSPYVTDPYATAFRILSCVIVTTVVIVILSQAFVTCWHEYKRENIESDTEVQRNTEINRKLYSDDDGDENQLLSLTENAEDKL